MTTTSTPDTTPTAPAGARAGSVRRVRALTRANAVLMLRNKLTLFNAVVMPLIPLALLVNARGDTDVGATAAGAVLFLALVFPVYYNVLSLFVTRRDELVLKRLRTGEARDGEQLVSLALPGALAAVVVMAISVGIGIGFGMPVPTNPLLYAVGGLVGVVIFTGLAFVTAAFSPTAESAQITSMPVIVIATLGTLVDVLPDRMAQIVEWTPVAALDTITEIALFGELDGSSLSFGETWAEAVDPLRVLVVWTVGALLLARRYLRWEPRA